MNNGIENPIFQKAPHCQGQGNIYFWLTWETLGLRIPLKVIWALKDSIHRIGFEKIQLWSEIGIGTGTWDKPFEHQREKYFLTDK